MEIRRNKSDIFSSIPFIAICFFVGWTTVIVGFLIWEINGQKDAIVKFALTEAIGSYNKDLVYRRWATLHGGVYVPVNNATQPNPYLTGIKERDIPTPSGKILTLINPAYMTRQVHELAQEQYGAKGHITSLKLLRPENKPDSWEKAALLAFEKGVKEVYSTSSIQGKKYLRLMRPMITEAGCLKCHGYQEYKVGDIRGGISVSVPLEPYEIIANNDMTKGYIIHTSIYLIGIVGMVLLFFNLHRKNMEVLVSKNRFQDIAESMSDWIWEINKEGRYTYCSNHVQDLLGYNPQEMLGKTPFDFMEPDQVAVSKDTFQSIILNKGKIKNHENWNITKNRQRICLLTNGVPIFDKDNEFVGYRGIDKDITEGKIHEVNLKKQELFLRKAQEIGEIGTWELDIKANILTWTDQNYKIFGVALGTPATYETFLNCVHPDDREFVNTEWMAAIDGKPYDIEHRLLVDGLVRWVREKAEFYYDGQGAIIRAIGVTQDITNKKLADMAVFESEQKFRLAFQTSPDAINLNRLEDGMYLEINQGFTQIIGYTREEVIGKTSLELNIWKNPADRKRLVEGLQKEGYVENLEAEFVGKNNRVKDGLMSARILKINNENIIISITRDYTERKHIERALKASEERFQLAMDASKDGIYDWDLETTTIYYSPGWKRMLGYEPDELPNDFSVWETLTHPDDVKASWTMLNEVVEGKRARFEKEFKMRHKEGHWVNILSRASVFKNDHTGKTRIVGTHVDVSERKRIEEELKLTTERFQKIFNSQLDAIFVLDNQNPPRVVEVNRSGEDMFGYSPLEMIGTTTESIHVSKKHLLSFQNSLFAALDSNGYLSNFEFSMKRKNGSVFPTEHVVVELLDAAGQRIGWVSVVRDISEKKKMEERIQYSQKMESIGNLAGGIAHDFNNILFPVVGIAEMLVEDLLPGSPEQENANEILQAGRRGAELVQQILAFSRQHDHKLSPTRLQFVIKEVLKLTRASIPANIEIKQYLQPDCGLILADSTQLHQIGMNLITNAYHAVQDTGGWINVEVREMEIKKELQDLDLVPGKYATLIVSDNGIGISKRHLDKIFDPYFTTKEKGKGTGLGLSVVYGIVKEHKGDIKVMSEPGKGTSFQIYIPVMISSPIEEKTSGGLFLPMGSERILLVDDEVPIAKLEKEMLERLGYSVSKRTSSVDALDAFVANPNDYDIVITDMSMPHMTGDQLAREIFKIRPDFPIIICTGFSERVNKEEAYAMGIKGFLMKPVVKSDLAKEVRRVLDEII